MFAATLLFAAFVIQLVPDVSDAARGIVRTIPLVCDARKSLLVPVRVNGLEVRPFLLDTGSSVTTIDERLTSRLSLPAAGRIASSIRLRSPGDGAARDRPGDSARSPGRGPQPSTCLTCHR